MDRYEGQQDALEALSYLLAVAETDAVAIAAFKVLADTLPDANPRPERVWSPRHVFDAPASLAMAAAQHEHPAHALESLHGLIRAVQDAMAERTGMHPVPQWRGVDGVEFSVEVAPHPEPRSVDEVAAEAMAPYYEPVAPEHHLSAPPTLTDPAQVIRQARVGQFWLGVIDRSGNPYMPSCIGCRDWHDSVPEAYACGVDAGYGGMVGENRLAVWCRPAHDIPHDFVQYYSGG